MTDGAEPRAASAGWPPSPRTARLALVCVVGAGLALRYAAALRAPDAAEWEADAFVWAWGGRDTSALAGGCRPAGLQAVWELCGALAGRPSMVAMRAAAIGLSLLTLACGWELVRTVLRWRRAGAESLGRAGLWLAILWAAWPGWVWGGARFVPEALAGAALCLVAAALLRWRMRPGWPRWLWLCLTGALALSVGGTVVWTALGAGLVAWLLCLPRAPVALPLLAAWLVATAGAVGVARVRDDGRPWRPDNGPAYALADLLEAPLELDDRESLLPDKRGDAVWRACREALADRPAATTLSRLGSRVPPLIAPSRTAGVAGHLLGVVDALLAAAVLVLGAATLFRLGAGRAARLGLGVAAATWLVAALAGATGPFALSGLLLVALALAVAGATSSRGRLPAVAAAAGALALALALAVLAWAPVVSGDTWLERLTHRLGQGRLLVALLAAGDSAAGPERLQAATLLMDTGAPFLRRPRLALEQARDAIRQLPTEDDAVTVLVRAEAECLRFGPAQDLAETLLDDDGIITPNGRMLADWVRDKARRARLDGLH